MCQKLNVSDIESARKSQTRKVSKKGKTGKCQKLKVSERKRQNRKVSEFRDGIINFGRTAMARPTKSPEHFYLLTFPEKHIGTFMVMVI